MEWTFAPRWPRFPTRCPRRKISSKRSKRLKQRAGTWSPGRQTSGTRTPCAGPSRRAWQSWDRSTIVLANAGIGPVSPEPTDQDWHDVIGVNLTGVFNAGRVAIPSMIENGQGGAIVLTSSTAGLIGIGSNSPGMLGYTAAKHGVIGLMRSWANYLAPHNIRVNSVAPDWSEYSDDGQRATWRSFSSKSPAIAAGMQNALPVEMVDPIDISNAILWLVSDDGRYVTGITLPVDAGFTNKR